jgi:hypothetical protein
MRVFMGVWLVLAAAGCTAKSDPNGESDTDTDVWDTDSGTQPVLAVEDLVGLAPFGQRVELSWSELSEGESPQR